MHVPDGVTGSVGSSGRGFATTRWSLVAAAGEQESAAAREALATLCKSYWYPVYAYVRRQGATAETAKDLTQEFFVRLLETDLLQRADQSKGRFRSYLLACCKHFLANERDKLHSQKRGGAVQVLSLDFQNAENRYAGEPSNDETAERIFDRQWALTLLQQVLGTLREEFQSAGKELLFDRLKPFLLGSRQEANYPAIAAELQTTEAALRVAVHRMRQRFRSLLRDSLLETVSSEAELDEEIRDLFRCLSR